MKIAVFAAAALLAAGSSHAELVQNGGFDNGFANWSLSGNLGFLGIDGSGAAYFGAVGSDTVMGQDIATASTGLFEIQFDLRSVGNGTSDFSVSFGGVDVFSTANTEFGTTHYDFFANGTGAQTLLQFEARNDPSYYYLDNVSVTAAVPEPASIALLLAGVGVVGFSARRRAAR